MAKARAKPQRLTTQPATRPAKANKTPAPTITRSPKPVSAKPAKAESPAPKKPRRKKAPVRLVARWAVYDSQMRPLAVFDYNQRGAAEQKVRELRAKKNAEYLIQLLKEPMREEPTETEADATPPATKPRPAKARSLRKTKKGAARTLA